jgi:hypothetical protein
LRAPDLVQRGHAAVGSEDEAVHVVAGDDRLDWAAGRRQDCAKQPTN